MPYALVTGASSGIGYQYARLLAEKGYGLVLVSNQKELNIDVGRQLSARFGVEVLPIYMDLTMENAAQCLYDKCNENGLEIDVLVSNAGILQFGRLKNATIQMTERIIALHCTFPAQACRLFGSDMARRGRGYILLMSSMASWLAYPTISLYSSTKAFLKNLGDALRYEFAMDGVHLTTVFPGAVDTPLYELSDSKRKWLRRLGIMSSAEFVARKGLNALFHSRRRCIPGLFTKLSVAFCGILPYSFLSLVLKVPVVRKILERN